MDNTMAVPVLQKRREKRINQRRKTIFFLVFAITFLAAIFIVGSMSGEQALATSLKNKNVLPCREYPFGTDWLGRDMLARTLKGLSVSIGIGIVASVINSIIALALGIAAATFGKKVDTVAGFLVDTAMGLPHLLLLILISVALGKGTYGVMIAVAITHWPQLTRVVRGEILQLKEQNYIKINERLGHSKIIIAIKHMVPHIFPQFLVGLILLFPHAILHEASVTFLGFGLPPEQPGIGVILSESMKYLSLGMWWLAVFPGFALLLTVMLFDLLGDSVRKIIDPHSSQN